MTAFTPVRIQCAYCTDQGHPCDCEAFEAADRGMSPMADRLRRSRTNMQFIADLPPPPAPPPGRADEAVGKLMEEYLKMTGGRL